MNRTPRLSKSGIEYLDYVWNFYSGCLNGCSYCWAKGITERFRQNYPNGFDPTYYPEAFLSPLYLKKPSIIGVAFMGDLFGDWIDSNKMISIPMVVGLSHAESLKGQVYRTIKQCPQHTFLFLTKYPQNLPQWSPFPDNCWVGQTLTGREKDLFKRMDFFNDIEARVKFISFEPLKESVTRGSDSTTFNNFVSELREDRIVWVIIGAQTKPYKPPKIEWVEEIVQACDKAGTKVFLKDNLKLLFGDDLFYPEWAMNKNNFALRQEMLE